MPSAVIPSFEFSLIILIITCTFFLCKAFLSPLRHIPGPLLARFTRLWLFREVYNSTFPLTNIELHQKYGSPLQK